MMRRAKERKNKTLTPNILESMTMAVTLSDRLRQVGIRECERDYGTKTNNLSQNRKNQPKKGLTEKGKERNKKLQNLCNECSSPYFKDCFQNKTFREKTLSKNCASFSKALRRKVKGSAKKTISASLNFIKDCQIYKKKVRNLEKHSGLNKVKKSESVFSNQNHYFFLKGEPQNLQIGKTCNQISFGDNEKNEEALILDVRNDKEAKSSCLRKDPSLLDQNPEKANMKKELIKDERESQSNKNVSETLSNVKPLGREFPTGDIAKIDKKYLQLLLSITNTKDTKYTTEDKSRSDEKKIREKHGQRKGNKKSNEVSPENNIRIKSEDKKDSVEEIQKNSETIQIPSYEKSVFAKTARDLAKSEAQLFVHKNNFYSQRNPDMKSEKNMTRTKPEVNDTRRNRKNRKKLLKNKNEEFSESVFSNEIPKVDIKELWRRDFREKSENSLSSNSSCAVPKYDADSEQKSLELESYKVLKKFVEEEVKKMSNESEKKNNLKETESIKYNFKINEFKSKNLKESEKVESICKKLKISKAENLNDEVDIIKNEMFSLKKKIMQTEHPQRCSIYEGENINSMLLRAFIENKLKNEKGNKKPLKEKRKSCENTPSQIVDNWSILNRLEQAFLALGTPNFQNKDIKNSKHLKDQELKINEKASVDINRKGQHRLEKISEEPQKSKEVEGKKGNKNASNALRSTIKTPKQSFPNSPSKPENRGQQNLIKSEQQKNKLKKAFENDMSQNNTIHEQIVAIQNKQKISNPATQENFQKNSTVESISKLKANVPEPEQSTRKEYKKPPSNVNVQAKKYESCQKKLPKVVVKNKDSEETSEKTKAFDIVQKKKLSKRQSTESKNCEKTHNFELGNLNISFSQLNNQKLKKKELFNKNLKDTSQSGDKNIKNTTTKSFIPKKLEKMPMKTKPEFNEKIKSINIIEPEENSVQIPEGNTEEEKLFKNEKEIKEFPTQIKEKVRHSREKVIKGRSILSVSGKQQKFQESMTKLMQVEGKIANNTHLSPQISSTENCETEKAQYDKNKVLEPSVESARQNECSTISILNISNLNLTDFETTESQKKIDINRRESSALELSKKLTPVSNISNINSISTQVSENETELGSPRCQTKMLWEQDMRHYRAIVKEIMNHYNRIKGFLTYSDYLQSFSTDSADMLLMKESSDKNSMSNKLMKMNLREYRKKIMSEYQALPIFEYKRLLQEKKENNLLKKEATRRNLMVVKDVTTEMDLDVKDFKPKIQQVLDSQLYVDVENLIKRNHSKVKFKVKKSSLQEIVLDKNEKMFNQKRLRTSSTIKTFPYPTGDSDCVESFQKLKPMVSLEGDLTDAVTSTSMEETESDYL